MEDTSLSDEYAINDTIEEDHQNIFDSLAKVFNHPSTLSLEIFVQLLLVISYVFIDYVLLRLYVMGFILLLLFIFIVYSPRYNISMMNTLDVVSILLLMAMVVMAMFDTINIYNVPEVGSKRERLHKAFDVLKVVFLFTPLLGILRYKLGF